MVCSYPLLVEVADALRASLRRAILDKVIGKQTQSSPRDLLLDFPFFNICLAVFDFFWSIMGRGLDVLG